MQHVHIDVPKLRNASLDNQLQIIRDIHIAYQNAFAFGPPKLVFHFQYGEEISIEDQEKEQKIIATLIYSLRSCPELIETLLEEHKDTMHEEKDIAFFSLSLHSLKQNARWEASVEFLFEENQAFNQNPKKAIQNLLEIYSPTPIKNKKLSCFQKMMRHYVGSLGFAYGYIPTKTNTFDYHDKKLLKAKRLTQENSLSNFVSALANWLMICGIMLVGLYISVPIATLVTLIGLLFKQKKQPGHLSLNTSSKTADTESEQGRSEVAKMVLAELHKPGTIQSAFESFKQVQYLKKAYTYGYKNTLATSSRPLSTSKIPSKELASAATCLGTADKMLGNSLKI